MGTTNRRFRSAALLALVGALALDALPAAAAGHAGPTTIRLDDASLVTSTDDAGAHRIRLDVGSRVLLLSESGRQGVELRVDGRPYGNSLHAEDLRGRALLDGPLAAGSPLLGLEAFLREQLGNDYEALARGASELAQALAARLEQRTRGRLGAERSDRPSLDRQGEVAHPDSFAHMLCTPMCWDCYGREFGLVGGAVGASLLCASAPMTVLTTVGCIGSSLAVIFELVNSVVDCRDCLNCMLCLDGNVAACESLSGGSGPSGGGDPLSCPSGTHTAPTSACGGSAPCCCDDWEPDLCF